MTVVYQKPSGAFIGASWFALSLTFVIALWNSSMPAYEKGFYFTVLMYGLFSCVSLQKAVRDRLEGIPVTGIYYGLAWVSVGLTILLLLIGLWNAAMPMADKGLYAIAFLMSLFAAIAVQKNTRDSKLGDGGGESQ
jgi:uncharacterized membrane protein YiaA